MPTTLAVRTHPGLDVPVAASTAVAPLLRRPAAGTVLARFPAAVYVRLDGGAVLAVVTSDGLRLPCALVVAATSAEDFVSLLAGKLGAGGIVTGDDFTFGKGRAGNVDVLERLAAGHGVAVRRRRQRDPQGIPPQQGAAAAA